MEKVKREIVGHSLQRKLLFSLKKLGFIPTAILFWGPESVGKKLIALDWIKSMYCCSENSVSCNKCRNCRLIEAKTHPDVMILEKGKGEILIDDIREIQRFVVTKPVYGQKKFVLIDSAERMNLVSANAFLKILEEPPAGVHFILVTSQRQRILPTVRSRCMSVRFEGLSLDILKKCVNSEGGIYEMGFSPMIPVHREEFVEMWKKFLFKYSGRPFILKDRDEVGFRMIAMGLHDILTSLLELSFLSYNVTNTRNVKGDIFLWQKIAESLFDLFKTKDIMNLSVAESYLSADIRRLYGR